MSTTPPPIPKRRTVHLVGAAFVSALVVAGIAGIVAAVVFTSTGDDTAAAAPTTTQLPTTAAATTTARATGESPRGNLVKNVGETAAVGRPGQPPVAQWTVTDIAVDSPCTSSIAQPPENGHFVTLTVEAETTPDFRPDALPGGLHPANNWAIVTSDGFTQPHAFSTPASRCEPLDFPSFLAPGSRYRFHLIFDSRTPDGVITFVPQPGASGWEWTFSK